MKKAFFTLFSIFILVACSKDHDSSAQPNSPLKADQYPQQWKLVKMTGSIADIPPAIGENMEWQEDYLLQSDGTFIKTRERENNTTTVKGTYAFVKLSDGTYLELIHESENTLLCNCSAELKEYLKLDTDTDLIGTCWACDGPGLFYKRIK
ncbi:hypothetical protein U6A24_03375 [Aquimarina gracilis]|uniref:Lipocalin-like protein n=1 Tax=Aquimarina gracilis TaxID=874422 RepID=A0ABU5ZR01_9FLAO|nr:hypothetical protein [Aquimarina gracilis]MEB3344484.1 hypothetical protein [Aquimarina gracilis]